MKRPDRIKDVLDVQLVDCEDRRCGRVDDVEVDADGSVVALLSGYACWPDRLPRRVRPLARRLVGDPAPPVRVPWDAVDRVGPYIHLNRTASDLGLGAGDDELRWLLGRLPWGHARRSG